MKSSQQIVDVLRQRGERLTLPRRLVIDVLCHSSEHLTLNDIQEQLQHDEYQLSEPTVYRILQWLKNQGIVSQTDLGHSRVVYQLIGGMPHHHLVCLQCGRVVTLDDSYLDPLRDNIRQYHDFEPRIDHMAVFGLCAECRGISL